MPVRKIARAANPDSQPRFPGVPIDLAGAVYVVPPLSIRALGEMREKFSAMVNAGGEADLSRAGDLLDLALAAVRRNYPEMTLDELGEAVDMGNFTQLIQAVLGQVPRIASPTQS